MQKPRRCSSYPTANPGTQSYAASGSFRVQTMECGTGGRDRFGSEFASEFCGCVKPLKVFFARNLRGAEEPRMRCDHLDVQKTEPALAQMFHEVKQSHF